MKLLKQAYLSIYCLTIFIATVLLTYTGEATVTFAQKESAQIHEFILKNGLKVIIYRNHKAPVATFQIWYKVGSIDEPKGKTGISHFLEHMMFKGTPKYGSKVLSKLVQKNGGIDNAYTTKDYTAYFQILPSDRINLSIELEADRITNLLLREEDVRYERAVVMEERRLRYDDDPESSLFEEVLLTAFKAHPYRWPVIGLMSDLQSITREDLYQYYKRFYTPSNAFIIVAGDVVPEEIMKHISSAFEKIEAVEIPERYYPQEPPQRGEKRVYLKKEVEVPYFLMAYHVPSFPHEDSAALEVLSTILTGKSGRLYKKIVSEKKIAASVDAFYSGLNRFSYLFFFDGIPLLSGEDKDWRKAVKGFEDALNGVIEDIKKSPPSEREVQKAKNQIEAAFIMAMDSVYSMARIIGTFELLGGWRLKDSYLEEIRSVKPEDVQRVARKYLVEDMRTVGILVPQRADK